MSRIERMTAKEFRELGYLQELNRQFLHPRGLALEVIINDDEGGTESFGQVWDFRGDPEGMVFGKEMSSDKAQIVQAESERHIPNRFKMFGWEEGVQPLDDPVSKDDSRLSKVM